jgi:hypothetical protein
LAGVNNGYCSTSTAHTADRHTLNLLPEFTFETFNMDRHNMKTKKDALQKNKTPITITITTVTIK